MDRSFVCPVCVAIVALLVGIYFWHSRAVQARQSDSVKLSPSSLLEFAYLMGDLKRTKRTGWVRKKVHEPESVADHMYRMAVMSWVFGDQLPHYNTDGATNTTSTSTAKLMKMALVHDMIEAICGDIVPIERISGVSKQQKYDLEHAAIIKIRDEYLKNTDVGQEMYDLWMEYEGQQTSEAKLIKDLDKLDMIIQAEEYEKLPQNDGIKLAEFFKGTRGVFQTGIGQNVDSELMRQREQRLQSQQQT
mmetsp:Transcript_59105/g.97713  ORF Transcript_59105/g.97713 Transcript_59105/m.97713 type:complete len:247 (+) Transcript_59105:11-751(+)